MTSISADTTIFFIALACVFCLSLLPLVLRLQTRRTRRMEERCYALFGMDSSNVELIGSDLGGLKKNFYLTSARTETPHFS